MRAPPKPVRLRIQLPGGYFGFAYEWLPKGVMYGERQRMAVKLEQEMKVLSAIRMQMPGCECLNVLAEAISQREKIYFQLIDKRRRMLPMPVVRIVEK